MKTVLITGAAKGIGAATARLFDKNGYAVAITYLTSAGEAETLCAKLTNARAYLCDISNPATARKTVDAVVSDFGSIDICVNNAAVSHYGLLSDMSDEDVKRILDVNVFGTLNIIRAVQQYMVSRKSGVITNISSIWGITGASCEVLYSTAKAAIIGLTKALAKELGPSGIRVNAVAPGFVKTDMTRGFSDEDVAAFCAETPLGRIALPEEIAEAVYFISSSKANFVTGQVISPNGGVVM